MKRQLNESAPLTTPKKPKRNSLATELLPSPITPIQTHLLRTPEAPKKLKRTVDLSVLMENIFDEIDLFNAEGIFGDKLIDILEQAYDYVKLMLKDGPLTNEEKCLRDNNYSSQYWFYICDLFCFIHQGDLDDQISSIIVDAVSFYKLFKKLESYEDINECPHVRKAYEQGVRIKGKIILSTEIDMSEFEDNPSRVLFIVAEKECDTPQYIDEDFHYFTGRCIDNLPQTSFQQYLFFKNLTNVKEGNKKFIGKKCMNCKLKVGEILPWLNLSQVALRRGDSIEKVWSTHNYFANGDNEVLCGKCCKEDKEIHTMHLMNKINRIN